VVYASHPRVDDGGVDALSPQMVGEVVVVLWPGEDHKGGRPRSWARARWPKSVESGHHLLSASVRMAGDRAPQGCRIAARRGFGGGEGGESVRGGGGAGATARRAVSRRLVGGQVVVGWSCR
jgi:hypothetical protein